MTEEEVGRINHDYYPEMFPFTRSVIGTAEWVDHSIRLYRSGAIRKSSLYEGLSRAQADVANLFIKQVMELEDEQENKE